MRDLPKTGKIIKGGDFLKMLVEEAEKGPITIETREGTFQSTLHENKEAS